jgi:hypothetical protein
MSKKTFSFEDLRRWQEKGLLSEEQLQQIAAEADLETAPAAGPETPAAEAGKKARLNPVVIAYYFGGFLALLSFTIFIAMRWEDLSDGERLATALSVMVITACLGAWLRFAQRYHIAGGIILFITAAVFPLCVYTVAEMAGLWPEPIRDSFEALSYALLYLSLISLPVAVFLLVITRFSLITLVVIGLVHFAISAIGGIASADQAIVTSATCGAFILLGSGLSLRGKNRYIFWLKLYGLVGLFIGLTTLFGNSSNALFGVLYLVVYLIIIVSSFLFQEIIYLVFGIIGFYTYIIRLIVDYLKDTFYFPLILGLIGISIVVLAVLYQRYHRVLFRRRSSSGNN